MTARRAAGLAALLLCLAPTAFAQFAGQLGVEETWTDNVFLVSDRETDWITRPFAELEWTLPGDVTPYYRGDGYLYARHPDLDAYVHRAGVAWERSFAEGRRAVALEGFYRGSLHSPDSDSLDYHEGAAELSLRFRPKTFVLIGPSVEASVRSYPGVGDLSFLEAGAGVFANLSFDTGTTVRLSGRLDYKRFLDEIETDASASAESKAGQSSGGGSNGGGSGSGGSGDGGSDSGGGSGSQGSQGNGSGRGQSAGDAAGRVGNTDTVDAAQAVARLRVAQSITPRVGGFVEGSYRVNLLDPPRYAEGAVAAVDREIFDDHYAYEGPGARARVTVLLPADFALRFDGSGEWRRFDDRPALDENGAPVQPEDDRYDQRYDAGIGLSWQRGFEIRFPAWLECGLEAGFARNLSNDDYYDTREFWASARVAIGW